MPELDADVLQVAEAHVRVLVQKVGLHVMSAETRAELAAGAKLMGEGLQRLKKIAPESGPDALEDLAPHGMQLFMLVKAYECGMPCIAEAIKRQVPELGPLIEAFVD